MAVKLSQIAPSPSNPASTDQIVGVRGGTTDSLFTVAQLQSGIGVAASTNTFDTRTTAITASIPSAVSFIQTLGYSAIGDEGGGIYSRVGALTLGGFQTADGQWWGLDVPGAAVNVKQFGAKGDGVQDDVPFIQNAIDFLLQFPLALQKILTFPACSAFYRLGSAPLISSRYPWMGPSTPGGLGQAHCLYLVGMKNLTIRGEGGDGERVKLIVDQSMISDATEVAVWDCDSSTNQTYMVVNPSSGYHTSLVSLMPLSNPSIPGTNWMTLLQGDITKFVQGDLCVMEGGQ